MRSRISDHLLGGRVDDSTFRYSLAALLKDIYDFRPLAMGNGGELTPTHNAQLTAWQDDHLRLTWAEHPEPWTIRPAVIAVLRPPLNLDHNAGHPFYPTLKSARARFRAAAYGR